MELQFHSLSMLKHMSNEQVGSNKIFRTDNTFQMGIVVVWLQVTSKMSWSSVSFLAALHDAAMISWWRNMVGSSMATFETGALWSRSTSIFESRLFDRQGFISVDWRVILGEEGAHAGLKNRWVKSCWCRWWSDGLCERCWEEILACGWIVGRGSSWGRGRIVRRIWSGGWVVVNWCWRAWASWWCRVELGSVAWRSGRNRRGGWRSRSYFWRNKACEKVEVSQIDRWDFNIDSVEGHFLFDLIVFVKIVMIPGKMICVYMWKCQVCAQAQILAPSSKISGNFQLHPIWSRKFSRSLPPGCNFSVARLGRSLASWESGEWYLLKLNFKKVHSEWRRCLKVYFEKHEYWVAHLDRNCVQILSSIICLNENAVIKCIFILSSSLFYESG